LRCRSLAETSSSEGSLVTAGTISLWAPRPSPMPGIRSAPQLEPLCESHAYRKWGRPLAYWACSVGWSLPTEAGLSLRASRLMQIFGEGSPMRPRLWRKQLAAETCPGARCGHYALSPRSDLARSFYRLARPPQYESECDGDQQIFPTIGNYPLWNLCAFASVTWR